MEGLGVRAAESYRQALAHDAENNAARLHLAVVLHDFDLESGALEMLDEASARFPPGHVPREFFFHVIPSRLLPMLSFRRISLVCACLFRSSSHI